VAFLASGCANKEGPSAPPKTEMGSTAAEQAKAEPVRTAHAAKPFEEKGITRVIYGFEMDPEGWGIPDWAVEEPDHVAKTVSISKDFAKEGSSSLKVEADFPGGMWTAALVEVMQYLDLGPYREISCDVYIPEGAPIGLKAKIIVTVGANWKFTEMSRSVPLTPGEWVTISANLLPGSEDWKMTVVDDSFRRDVRKIDVRVESNKSPVYKGAIYIDNIKVKG